MPPFIETLDPNLEFAGPVKVTVKWRILKSKLSSVVGLGDA
jgi:hypothetical protein